MQQLGKLVGNSDTSEDAELLGFAHGQSWANFGRFQVNFSLPIRLCIQFQPDSSAGNSNQHSLVYQERKVKLSVYQKLSKRAFSIYVRKIKPNDYPTVSIGKWELAQAAYSFALLSARLIGKVDWNETLRKTRTSWTNTSLSAAEWLSADFLSC